MISNRPRRRRARRETALAAEREVGRHREAIEQLAGRTAPASAVLSAPRSRESGGSRD